MLFVKSRPSTMNSGANYRALLSCAGSGAKGGHDFIYFASALIGLGLGEEILIAIKISHFLGDDGELFEFVGRLDGAAEQFPKALEQKLRIGIPKDRSIVVTMRGKRHGGANLHMLPAELVDLRKVSLVKTAQCRLSYFHAETFWWFDRDQFNDFVIGVVGKPLEESGTLFGRNSLGKNSRRGFSIGLFMFKYLSAFVRGI